MKLKLKKYLGARGPPGVSGALHSLCILRIGRIGSVVRHHLSYSEREEISTKISSTDVRDEHRCLFRLEPELKVFRSIRCQDSSAGVLQEDGLNSWSSLKAKVYFPFFMRTLAYAYSRTHSLAKYTSFDSYAYTDVRRMRFAPNYNSSPGLTGPVFAQSLTTS